MEHPLRRYRKDTETTLDALAEKIGATAATLSRIETGKQDPSLDLVRRLIEATGGAVSASDFLSAPQPAEDAA